MNWGPLVPSAIYTVSIPENLGTRHQGRESSVVWHSASAGWRG